MSSNIILCLSSRPGWSRPWRTWPEAGDPVDMAGENSPPALPLGNGVLQNLLGKSSQILASILLAAVLVQFLGLGPYGIWALIQFLVGSSILLDFGMAGYVERAVATDLANGARSRASAALRLALFASCALSLLLAGGLALVRAPLVRW